MKYCDDHDPYWDWQKECPDCKAGKEIYQLYNRVEELESAIKKHRDQTGHNLCWENDQELWAVLNDGVVIDHTPPAWDEFMLKCVEYRKSRDK